MLRFQFKRISFQRFFNSFESLIPCFITNLFEPQKSCSSYCFRRRLTSSCPLPVDPQTTQTTTAANEHKSLCFSLLDNLIHRGSFATVQRVIQRMIETSTSVQDSIIAADFATMRGLDLDLRNYDVLISKLISHGEYRLAEVLYCDNIIGKGVEPGLGLLNSMVVCYCNLGKLKEGKALFDAIFEKELHPATCNAIVRELCAQDRELEAFECFKGINNTGIVLKVWCYNLLIDSLSFKGYLNEAIHVFDIMSDRTGLPPSVHLYKTLVYELCKRGLAEEAELLCIEMEAQGLYIDKSMYTSVINVYCKNSKMKMAMRFFLRMLKKGCDPDCYTYNTLIHGFVLMGLFNKGWILHNQMADLGVKPDMVTYHVMISRYCREQKVDCALTLLNSMIEHDLIPPVHCYTIVITSLYKENRLMEVDELYKKMLDNGVVPDHVLFFTLMKYFPNGGELQLALLMLQAIAKNGCLIDPSLISNSAMDLDQVIELLANEIAGADLELGNVAFGICISCLCARGKIDAALDSMRKMVDLGCKPFLSTYNSMIKCLLQEGLFDDANSLMGVMQDMGMVPNLATYLILINSYCKQGDLVSAFDVLNQMEEREIRPNVAIYDSIIGCLSRRKKMFEAGTMFKRMLKSGIEPDEVVYVTMINGYSKSGRAIESMLMFDKMIEDGIQPSARAYTALIYGLVKKNMIDKGCLYLNRMLEDGFVPNNVLYTSLINQFLRKGEFEVAYNLVILMEKKEIEIDLITYITLVSGFCRNITLIRRRKPISSKNSTRGVKKLLDLLQPNSLLPCGNLLRISSNCQQEINCFVQKLVRQVKDSLFMPNLYLYNSMIYGFCLSGLMNEAYDLLEMMQKQGLNPNNVTFTIFIGGHIRLGDIDTGIELFNKMNANGCAPDKIAYNALVRSFCKAGRLLDALSLAVSMRKRGFIPNKASYEFLLNRLCANYLSSDAFIIFEEMLSHHFVPCRYNYNWLLCLLCEDNKMLEADSVLDIMLKRGKYPDESTKMHLLKHYRGNEKLNWILSLKKILMSFESGAEKAHIGS